MEALSYYLCNVQHELVTGEFFNGRQCSMYDIFVNAIDIVCSWSGHVAFPGNVVETLACLRLCRNGDS